MNWHSGHTLDKCRDFWEAASCTERRNMLAESSCFTCLGRDQGCSNGTCAIISEVPPETVCQGCAKSSRAEQPPPNVLCCGLPFHKKPPTGVIVAAMERFVPDLRAAKFGMTPEVNVVRAEPVSTVERACVPSTPNWAYNTQTGTTKKVEAKDRVLTTSNQCACYIMQQLNIAGERALTFYDSGAKNNLVEFELAQDADFQLLSLNSVSFKVTGGGSVRTDRGQFSAILGPDVNGDYHDLECQAVDRITGEFPVFLLHDAIKEANAAIGEGHVFPPEIGGTHVRLLIGIRNTQLAPVLRLVLHSGLCLYNSKFRDVYGSTLCFGGPHGVFTEGYAAAGMFASADAMQICFTQIASAFLNAPRTFMEDRPRAESDETVTFEEVEVFEDSMVRKHSLGDEGFELRKDLDQIVASGSAGPDEYLDPDVIGSEKSDSELAILRCYHFEECASPEACYKALIPLSKLKGLVDQNDIPDVTDFRCDVCASCPTCMRSAQERTKSLQEEFEQSIILKSVHLEPENQRVAVKLPFVKEPVEFLTKKTRA